MSWQLIKLWSNIQAIFCPFSKDYFSIIFKLYFHLFGLRPYIIFFLPGKIIYKYISYIYVCVCVSPKAKTCLIPKQSGTQKFGVWKILDFLLLLLWIKLSAQVSKPFCKSKATQENNVVWCTSSSAYMDQDFKMEESVQMVNYTFTQPFSVLHATKYLHNPSSVSSTKKHVHLHFYTTVKMRTKL